MKLDAAQLIAIEQRLAQGEIPEGALPVLLEALRHVLRCRFGRERSAASTERRHPRHGAQGKKKGHGRHGSDDYTRAERIVLQHAELKPGDPCPEIGCRGKLHDTNAPANTARAARPWKRRSPKRQPGTANPTAKMQPCASSSKLKGTPERSTQDAISAPSRRFNQKTEEQCCSSMCGR